MRSFVRRIDTCLGRNLWDEYMSHYFQLRPFKGYRHKSPKSLFRGDYGYYLEAQHWRGLKRVLVRFQDDRDELGFHRPRWHSKQLRSHLFNYWDDDYHHPLRGFKSWKKRCRKRHQWEHHRHSKYELSLPDLGYSCLRPFILHMIHCNDGIYTFTTAHRTALNDVLCNMEWAGEIIYD